MPIVRYLARLKYHLHRSLTSNGVFGTFVWNFRLESSFEAFVCSLRLESSLELSRNFLRVRISPTMLTFNVWAIDAVPRMISPDVGDKKRHLLKLCAYSKGVQEELK